MHSETNSSIKETIEFHVPISLEQKSSFLEEDLAISSSTHDSIVEKVIPEVEKVQDESTRLSSNQQKDEQQNESAAMIYVSEDAMDCNYDESSNFSRHFEIQDAPSPELFDSDADDEAESTNTTSTYQNGLEESRPTQPSPIKLTPAEQILRADKFLLRRVNKYLSGVPPPPNHTISQRDCNDFLVYIKQNRQYFWADPFELDKTEPASAPEPPCDVFITALQEPQQDKNEGVKSTSDTNKITHNSKTGLRNLSTAFDECEQADLKSKSSESIASDTKVSDATSSLTLSETFLNNSFLSTSSLTPSFDDRKCFTDNQKLPTLYTSIAASEAVLLSWPASYVHKCHEIYYNRNKSIEEFENLRMKICDRYIGAETQSTCNTWFAKQIPGSAKKRSLLHKFSNGQSPGKRLSYLARRRRTFSSANLQGLGLSDKKQFLLNIKKGVMRKGKSPRGKSPRGKSPRGKTPRSSAKKRYHRKLLLEGQSPRKTKIEISKRALFQSPPHEKPGTSKTVISTTFSNNNPQKIKRALFPTPKKSEACDNSQSQSLSYPESRKRKSDEELEHAKQKWPKSLSFDCSQSHDSLSNSWNSIRHSTSNILSKDASSKIGKNELSETHRKKLLWAVAEALRCRGVGVSHPMFKQWATSLARTVKKLMPDLDNKNVPRKPGSTSDRMLRLAKKHVLLVVDAKTAL